EVDEAAGDRVPPVAAGGCRSVASVACAAMARRNEERQRDERRIGIIGAGPGGIATAIRMLEAGHDDVVLLEKASGVGGTWWHNRYPGLSCDIPSHLYSFSFAPKVDWSRPYGSRDEIHAYMDEVVDRFALRDRIH